jgi:hypothetical protein
MSNELQSGGVSQRTDELKARRQREEDAAAEE